MNVFLYGEHAASVRKTLLEEGIGITDDVREADLIFIYGGDGAMLSAAAEYPDRLKFAMRDFNTAPLCPEHQAPDVLAKLREGAFHVTDLPRLRGSANGETLYGINDIFIHNRVNVSAMRYDVAIDSELYGSEIVGDGVGVATVHGATAYYRSITHSIFRTGIGLAFSNSTEAVNHLVLPETSVIRIRILRGPCEMTADNSPHVIPMKEGDIGEICLSKETTPVLGLECFMCPRCRKMRHDLRKSLPGWTVDA